MWHYVLLDVLQEMRHLPTSILVGSLTYILSCICMNSRINRKKAFYQAVLVMYLVLLAEITLLERETGSRIGISLCLFETMGNLRDNAYVLENLILFIPYGFLLPYVWKWTEKLGICVFLGFATSILIEVLQLVSGRGYFQVDDILMNTLGMGCGWIIYRVTILIKRILYRVIRKSSVLSSNISIPFSAHSCYTDNQRKTDDKLED